MSAKRGRPLIVSTPEEMEDRAAAYFDKCAQSGEIPRITALALSLGLAGRQSLLEYQERKVFSDTVKRLKSICEDALLKASLESGCPPAVGIFCLKNFGWTDQLRLEHEGLGPVPIQIIQDAGDNSSD